MIAVPAVDVRGGRCVQLEGGRPDRERISLPDPVAVAASWVQRGFDALHVVDLDAALDHGDNRSVIDTVIAGRGGASIQVGGGVRTDDRVAEILGAGAERVVVGTRALDDPTWLATLVERWPRRVVLAVDTRDGSIVRRGWTETTAVRAEDFLPTLADLPLGGVLSTDVSREGRLAGIDHARFRDLIRACPHPLWASGGVTSIDDLAYLEDVGAAGAVLGMALYSGRLDADEVAERWGRRGPERDATSADPASPAAPDTTLEEMTP